MKITCPECQTEAAPGMKFCRNCGEKLPEALPSVPIATGTTLPPPNQISTASSPSVPFQKPPEAFKTVARQAITPPKPPGVFRTAVEQPVPGLQNSTAASTKATEVSLQQGSSANELSKLPDAGNRFIYLMLALVALGFLAGVGLFLAVYVFGEKPKPAVSVARTDTELLDTSITRLELCSFRVLPTDPEAFDGQATTAAFPAGIRAVAIRVSGRTRPDGDYRLIWRRLETSLPLLAQSIQSLSETQQVVRLLYQPDGTPLPNGAYVAEVQDGERPLARAYFTIGLPANP